MFIYNTSDLYNKHVQEQASEAFAGRSINEETYKNILTAFPCKLYTPNYFIRIALGVLTLVAIIFSAFLVGLMSVSSGLDGWMILFFFLGAINYIALELLVKANNYYNAGVDNLLLFFSAAFVVCAFVVKDYSGHNIAISGVAMLVCLMLTARFVNGFMSMLAYLSFFVFVFLLFSQLGNIAKATAPFLMMIVSAAAYALVKKLSESDKLLFYRGCFKYVMLLALLTFYTSGNYYVIKELSNEMFDLRLGLKDPIPFGWLFWILTFIIPPVYLIYGIIKKDILLIRTGSVLIAATVLTFRYYYTIVPLEVAMLTGGALLIAVSYTLIKYLKTAKRGYSFEKNETGNSSKINLRSLILTQVAGQKSCVEKGVEFSGGSFGSGGAGGSY